jgi:hypothetical protein
VNADYGKCHFSITCHTDDRAVLFCLRALCQYCEQHPKRQIGWGGTESKDWKAAGGRFTLRFTSPSYRDDFVREAERLFQGRWRAIRSDDRDPAVPQR